ncbi:MAG: NUDIX hydrolase [Actinomycetota bacterium]|nr:NUDIX hydrolase [Actinomycetota bacterium]MEE2958707.1 NUDIX hydrolase [Actinomycetota bacterium]
MSGGGPRTVAGGPAHRDHNRYDAYARNHAQHGDSELIPAATVVLLSDGAEGVETLMLRKNSKIAFGGMWVFPGGRIDEGDAVLNKAGEPDGLATAAVAAVREAHEEASVALDPATLVWFAHWVPPPVMPKRFATFFFAAPWGGRTGDVTIDDGEITEHEWMRPVDAMKRRDVGDIELAPPTWVTLNRLAGFASVNEALDELGADEPPFYETHMARTEVGPVAMWTGDAGYEASDPSLEGPRHRLTMAEDGYRFEDTRTGT